MSKSIEFPAGFLWGTATSAHQIEGSPLADGAGPSIWQRFSHTPNLVRDGDTGDVACDHYRRYAEDVALMRSLGTNAYRFSIAWARILPNGRGAVNEAGLGFYDRLVDALLESGIAPMATLFHWDLPAALDDRGGWLNPDMADWFADYATVVFRKLDDRVKLWSTLNEPWVVTDGGYLYGALAPGHRSRFEAPIATHNLLRAHGKAVQAYRSVGRHQIGIVVNIEPKYAASNADEDVAATARADAYMNLQYLDPVFLGRYPDALAEVFGEAWPDWPAEDMALIRQPIDFVGINYYTRSVTRHDHDHWLLHAAAGAAKAGDLYRDRMGGVSARPDRYARAGQGALRQSSDLHHGKRRGVLRSADCRRRPRPGSVTRGVSARSPSCDPCRHGAGRGPARLLRVVAARQFRVVARLLQALRHRARRLRDAAADAEGQRAVLRRGHRDERQGAGRARCRLPRLGALDAAYRRQSASAYYEYE